MNARTCPDCRGTGIRAYGREVSDGCDTCNAMGFFPDGHYFQTRVRPWLMMCFGLHVANDRIERNHRFIEEALELVQSTGCTRDDAHKIVDYVFSREPGETRQEIGGVMVTLAALCLANGFDMHEAGEIELIRVHHNIDKIRAKQANKVKDSALPGRVKCDGEHAEPVCSDPECWLRDDCTCVKTPGGLCPVHSTEGR